MPKKKSSNKMPGKKSRKQKKIEQNQKDILRGQVGAINTQQISENTSKNGQNGTRGKPQNLSIKSNKLTSGTQNTISFADKSYLYAYYLREQIEQELRKNKEGKSNARTLEKTIPEESNSQYDSGDEGDADVSSVYTDSDVSRDAIERDTSNNIPKEESKVNQSQYTLNEDGQVEGQYKERKKDGEGNPSSEGDADVSIFKHNTGFNEAFNSGDAYGVDLVKIEKDEVKWNKVLNSFKLLKEWLKVSPPKPDQLKDSNISNKILNIDSILEDVVQFKVNEVFNSFRFPKELFEKNNRELDKFLNSFTFLKEWLEENKLELDKVFNRFELANKLFEVDNTMYKVDSLKDIQDQPIQEDSESETVQINTGAKTWKEDEHNAERNQVKLVENEDRQVEGQYKERKKDGEGNPSSEYDGKNDDPYEVGSVKIQKDQVERDNTLNDVTFSKKLLKENNLELDQVKSGEFPNIFKSQTTPIFLGTRAKPTVRSMLLNFITNNIFGPNLNNTKVDIYDSNQDDPPKESQYKKWTDETTSVNRAGIDRKQYTNSEYDSGYDASSEMDDRDEAKYDRADDASSEMDDIDEGGYDASFEMDYIDEAKKGSKGKIDQLANNSFDENDKKANLEPRRVPKKRFMVAGSFLFCAALFTSSTFYINGTIPSIPFLLSVIGVTGTALSVAVVGAVISIGFVGSKIKSLFSSKDKAQNNALALDGKGQSQVLSESEIVTNQVEDQKELKTSSFVPKKRFMVVGSFLFCAALFISSTFYINGTIPSIPFLLSVIGVTGTALSVAVIGAVIIIGFVGSKIKSLFFSKDRGQNISQNNVPELDANGQSQVLSKKKSQPLDIQGINNTNKIRGRKSETDISNNTNQNSLLIKNPLQRQNSQTYTSKKTNQNQNLSFKNPLQGQNSQIYTSKTLADQTQGKQGSAAKSVEEGYRDKEEGGQSQGEVEHSQSFQALGILSNTTSHGENGKKVVNRPQYTQEIDLDLKHELYNDGNDLEAGLPLKQESKQKEANNIAGGYLGSGNAMRNGVNPSLSSEYEASPVNISKAFNTNGGVKTVNIFTEDDLRDMNQPYSFMKDDEESVIVFHESDLNVKDDEISNISNVKDDEILDTDHGDLKGILDIVEKDKNTTQERIDLGNNANIDESKNLNSSQRENLQNFSVQGELNQESANLSRKNLNIQGENNKNLSGWRNSTTDILNNTNQNSLLIKNPLRRGKSQIYTLKKTLAEEIQGNQGSVAGNGGNTEQNNSLVEQTQVNQGSVAGNIGDRSFLNTSAPDKEGYGFYENDHLVKSGGAINGKEEEEINFPKQTSQDLTSQVDNKQEKANDSSFYDLYKTPYLAMNYRLNNFLEIGNNFNLNSNNNRLESIQPINTEVGQQSKFRILGYEMKTFNNGATMNQQQKFNIDKVRGMPLDAKEVKKLLVGNGNNIISPSLTDSNNDFYYNAMLLSREQFEDNENQNFIVNVSARNAEQLDEIARFRKLSMQEKEKEFTIPFKEEEKETLIADCKKDERRKLTIELKTNKRKKHKNQDTFPGINYDANMKDFKDFSFHNVTDHIISLNKIVKEDGKRLYVLTDTVHTYKDAYEMIIESIKRIDSGFTDLVIKDVYRNENNDCAIAATVNSEVVPKIQELWELETIKSPNQANIKKEANIKKQIINKIKQFQPAEIIKFVRDYYIASSYKDHLLNTKNIPFCKEQISFCKSYIETLESSLPELFTNFTTDSQNFKNSNILNITNKYHDDLEELIHNSNEIASNSAGKDKELKNILENRGLITSSIANISSLAIDKNGVGSKLSNIGSQNRKNTNQNSEESKKTAKDNKLNTTNRCNIF